MNQSEKYLGILTQLVERKYDDGNPYLIGRIECPQIQNRVSFHQKSLNWAEVNDLQEGIFIFFETKISFVTDRKDPNKTFERLDAVNCSLNCEQIILEDIIQYDILIIKFIFKHATDELKTKLVSKIETTQEKSPISEVLKKIDSIKKALPKLFQITENHDVETQQEIQQNLPVIEKVAPKSFLETIFETNTSEYNQNLFHILVDGLKTIDNEEVFQQAKFLLKFNSTTNNNIENLNSIFYHKATDIYKFRLWFEKLTDYCSTEILKFHFEKAELGFKNEILERCQGSENGFLVLNNQVKNSNEVEEVYFSGIRQKLLQELNEAKKSIFVAMAWFTNDDLFSMLCMKLEQGVKVELIIINDYINNWEFGLPFQAFIDLGGKLYLREYPSIMHHKFCLIDNEIIFNGSYNWTYYAEMRNDENVMMFKGKPNLMEEFKTEFRKLKSKLGNHINKVIPFDSSQIPRFERTAFRQYFSTDLTLRAEKRLNKDIIQSSNILTVAIDLDKENIEAKNLQKKIQPKVELQKNVILVKSIVSDKTETVREQLEEISETKNFFENIEEDKNNIPENKFLQIQQDESVGINIKPVVSVQQTPIQETQKTVTLQKEGNPKPIKRVLTPNYSNKTSTQEQKTTPFVIRDYSSPNQKPVKKQFQNLRIALALDISGSMKDRYNNGTMQQVIEKTLALAIGLSTDETLSVWAFDTTSHPLKSIKQSDFSGYISREILSKYKIDGGTETFCVLNSINNHFVNQNVFVIVLTDGEDTKESEMRQIIQQNVNKPIFWQFIGIGDKFSKLEALNNANKNVSFFSLNNISTISDDELYKKLLTEFPIWYKESETKGLIK